jgi:hypothetical protein
MHAERIQVKVFTSGKPDVPGYVPVLQRWIRDRVLNELLIDVVDYSHVAEGPEVALIGHESDYVLDRAGGKLGLLYASKRSAVSEHGAFLPALQRVFNACLLLEKEAGPQVPFAFRADELLVRVADRLGAPNNDATFSLFEPALREALGRIYGSTPFTLSRSGSPRELFSIEVRAPAAPPLCELLPRLAEVA